MIDATRTRSGSPSELPADRAHWRALLGPAAVLLMVFFLGEHTLSISLNDHHAASQDEMESWTAGGDWARQLAFATLGGLGFLYLLKSPQWPLDTTLATALLLLFAWCAASTLWSLEPSTTARRAAVLLLWSLGAVGFALRFGLDDLARIVVLVSGSMLVLGLAAELYLGTFRPSSEGYRFAGTVHPNTQAAGCALLCLAAGSLALVPQKKSLLMIAVLCIGLGFLILTRSRTSLLAMLIGAGSLWLLTAPLRTKVTTGVAALWTLTAVMFALVLTTPDFDQRLMNAALLGREEQSESLTGRVPLWEELYTYITTRPLQGHGYQAFWTAEHIASVSREMEWAITEAHSAYVDGILQIGLIGAALALFIAGLTLLRSRRQFLGTGSAGDGFIFATVIFCLIQAMTESSMSSPMWVPWVVASAVCHLAIQSQIAPQRAQSLADSPDAVHLSTPLQAS